MSPKLLIDVGVELLHHEDQDDILSPRVYRMIVLYLHVLGCTVRVLYRGLRVSEANLLWLAHRPIGQPKSRISGTFVPRVRVTFFHHEFSSQDWLFLHTRNFGQ